MAARCDKWRMEFGRSGWRWWTSSWLGRAGVAAVEQAAGRWGDGVAMQVVLPASVAGPRGGEPPWCGGEDGGCGGRGWGARREAAGRVGSDGRKPRPRVGWGATVGNRGGSVMRVVLPIGWGGGAAAGAAGMRSDLGKHLRVLVLGAAGSSANTRAWLRRAQRG